MLFVIHPSDCLQMTVTYSKLLGVQVIAKGYEKILVKYRAGAQSGNFDNSIKSFISRQMNKIINAKRFDSYAAIIISGTIQRQRCDACLNTVGYGKKVG